jgi:hypothetical protein
MYPLSAEATGKVLRIYTGIVRLRFEASATQANTCFLPDSDEPPPKTTYPERSCPVHVIVSGTARSTDVMDPLFAHRTVAPPTVVAVNDPTSLPPGALTL